MKTTIIHFSSYGWAFSALCTNKEVDFRVVPNSGRQIWSNSNCLSGTTDAFKSFFLLLSLFFFFGGKMSFNSEVQELSCSKSARAKHPREYHLTRSLVDRLFSIIMSDGVNERPPISHFSEGELRAIVVRRSSCQIHLSAPNSLHGNSDLSPVFPLVFLFLTFPIVF